MENKFIFLYYVSVFQQKVCIAITVISFTIRDWHIRRLSTAYPWQFRFGSNRLQGYNQQTRNN